MSEHYIRIRTVNAKMKRMYDDEFTWTERGIEKRSNGLHVEIQFSTRYGNISFSCTLADGVGGCRFKMIGYSHPYRWSTIRKAVTAEQEARLFAKACKMADVEGDAKTVLVTGLYIERVKAKEIFYGSDHIKYDRWGATFSFISKLRIWRMHPENMICNEAVAEVMLVVWPDLLVIDQEYHEAKADIGSIAPTIFIESYNNADPATLTPDQFEYMVRYHFEHTDKPNQQDINNIIREVNDE